MRMDTGAGRHLRHRCFRARRLPRDLRLQLEAVELPDDEHVARPERAHTAVESRAVVAYAGREVVVDVAGVDAGVGARIPRPR